VWICAKPSLNASKDKTQLAQSVNPLVQEGMKLIPSVTRVFDSSKDLFVYLQAYEQGQESIQPLFAFVTFYRGDKKVFETPPIQATEGINNRIKTVPLKFSFPLEKLVPGEYACQVTVLDPARGKAAFWQAPIMIAP
jgi:hypothetical protein